jgi:hypothetical protein
MAAKFLPPAHCFDNREVLGWKLLVEVGRGKNGVVYKAEQEVVPGTKDTAAFKLIPVQNLRDGWPLEVKKAILLTGVEQAVWFKQAHKCEIEGQQYAALLWHFVEGLTLREYAYRYRINITVSFIDNLIRQLLRLFLAMKEVQIAHNDLHDKNILIADPDPKRYEQIPTFKVTDFGIGCSLNDLKPKDDYVQLTSICHWLLDEFIDPAQLTQPSDRTRYDYLVSDFLLKRILEDNPTVGTYVRNPRELISIIEEHPPLPIAGATTTAVLNSPFDYLSCEQIGDSFTLLHALYSQNFPGYDDLLQKGHTVLTGPRGCGKTTIFRNLSLKAQLLSRQRHLLDLDSFVGIYYHCGDLYFPFQYMRHNSSPTDDAVLVHYFNLAVLREIFETLCVAQNEPAGRLEPAVLYELQSFLKTWLHSYSFPPQGTNILSHLLSAIETEKHRVSTWLQRLRRDVPPFDPLLPRNFLPGFCDKLSLIVPWLRGRKFYFLLDDYSMPHISEHMQEVLHDCILFRWPDVFFKLSTESITTFHPYDSSGKLLEETREYTVVDLGACFFSAPKRRKQFLREVINNRLRTANKIHESYHDIERLLGKRQWGTYNALARMIRAGRSRVHYTGFDTIADLFSGDIAHMLYLIRNIFLATGPMDMYSAPGAPQPITREVQNFAIRDYAGTFLTRVGYAPGTGSQLVKIAQEFGSAANWLLKNRNSRNQGNVPPWQTFRIVVRDSFSFDDLEPFERVYKALVPTEKMASFTLANFVADCRAVYNDLVKYAVFLRDARGKSLRGAVVPRLYLRRLLVPLFTLTPNQRDSISLEVDEFITLLYKPSKFQAIARRKDPGDQETQERLFS